MKKSISELDVKGKRVLVRVDFNVPIKDGKITDDFRIVASLKTIKYLLDKGARVVLMSHLGRPKGEYKPEYSMEPVKIRLEELLGQKVYFIKCKEVANQDTLNMSLSLKDGEVMLLENTRFNKTEEKNGIEFAEMLASHGDIFVNDAFGTAHRAHSSNVGVSNLLPSAVGFLVLDELNNIEANLNNPKHPFTAILGGAKVSDKIGVIENLLDKVDNILIGGAMANTFLKALGHNMGKSLVEDEKLDIALDLITKAEKNGVKLVLPLDLVVADQFDDANEVKTVSVESVPEQFMALDIGEKTIEEFGKIIKDSKLIIWNGPMGVFENKNFNKGTFLVCELIANSDAISIIGGGDSAAAVKQSGYENKVTHVSTGGGASLEMMEGKVLPGIEAIEDR